MAKDKSIFEKMYPEIKLDTTLDDRPQLRAGRPFETKREFFIQAADRRPAYVREAKSDPTSPSARLYNLGKDSLTEAAMSTLPLGKVKMLAPGKSQSMDLSAVARYASRKSGIDATIWPAVGRKTAQAYRAVRNMDFAPAGRFLRSAASNASVPFKAAAEAVLVPASKVIPMSKRMIPTVIEDVITPWVRAHKAMAASGAILSTGTVGGTIYIRMSDRSGQDAVTRQVSQARSDVSNNWAKIEKDIDLSDAAAVKARVSNIRDALEFDVQKFGGNDAEVRRAIGEAESRIAPLRGSKGWKDAIVNATTEYMAGAADPANYESEYKSIYKDEESQILGSDFGRLFRKGAK